MMRLRKLLAKYQARFKIFWLAALASCSAVQATPITGSKTDTLVYNPLGSAPTCPSGKACSYALSADSQVYDVDAAGLILKSHAAKSFRSSASCSALASPANGDVCYDTGSSLFRFYSAGWTSAPVNDSLLVHKAGSETITGAKNFGGQKLAGVATPTVSTDAATKGYVDAAAPEIFWTRTCTITSAAAATPVTCLSDGAVGTKSAYLMGWRLKVNGATAWGTTTTCSIKDSLAVAFSDVPVSLLGGNSLVDASASGVTHSAAYSLNQGSTASRGLVVVCDADGTGSDLVVTMFGSIK